MVSAISPTPIAVKALAVTTPLYRNLSYIPVIGTAISLFADLSLRSELATTTDTARYIDLRFEKNKYAGPNLFRGWMTVALAIAAIATCVLAGASMSVLAPVYFVSIGLMGMEILAKCSFARNAPQHSDLPLPPLINFLIPDGFEPSTISDNCCKDFFTIFNR